MKLEDLLLFWQRKMLAVDLIQAFGHKNVRATHRTTLEITKESFLTPRGDCIIGINSNKSANELSFNVKELIKRNSHVYLVLKVYNDVDIVHGFGDPRLTLENKTKLIFRKSNFISDATVMIRADKSAKDIKREIIEKLKNEKTQLTAFLVASDSPLEDVEILRVLINTNPSAFS